MSNWARLFAGGLGGACQVLVTMPLDVVKTNVQVYPSTFQGPVDCVSVILEEKGLGGLYSGLWPFLLQISGKAAVRFALFRKCREVASILGLAQLGSTLRNFVAGLMAGAFEGALWTTPTERLKVLRQTHPEMQGRSAPEIIKAQGVRGMLVGIVPTVIRQAFSIGFRILCYAPIKAAVKGFLQGSGIEHGMLPQLLAGSIAAGLSVAISHPVDVIKSLAQSDRHSDDKGIVGIATEIYRESGVTGYYAGVAIRVFRVFCGQAITYAVYVGVVRALDRPGSTPSKPKVTGTLVA
mmetsp:Transcript_21385/g.40068  ORF Transcript_21385/g.40068 Transcript_21385/m.40068 type:complete len:294 (-) Transcript_21385:149-1030(-)